jgi:hypothetical protein
MRVGIKFCGGCNPRYDRSAACDEIRRVFEASGEETPSMRFSYAKEGESYDILLMLAGCANACADTTAYSFSSLVIVCGLEDVRRAVDEIKAFATNEYARATGVAR